MCFGFFWVYVEDTEGHPQGDSYRSLSETGQGILLGFWLCPLSGTVWSRDRTAPLCSAGIALNSVPHTDAGAVSHGVSLEGIISLVFLQRSIKAINSVPCWDKWWDSVPWSLCAPSCSLQRTHHWPLKHVLELEKSTDTVLVQYHAVEIQQQIYNIGEQVFSLSGHCGRDCFVL